MAFGVIRAKLFLHIISEHMNLNFNQTKVVCSKINSVEILSFFIYIYALFENNWKNNFAIITSITILL
jgi:hypothetical protein